MKSLLLILVCTSIHLYASSQSVVAITNSSQYGTCRGGMNIDSMLAMPIKDTVNPFVFFSNARKTGRTTIKPGDFRMYVYDGTKWRPINTFTSAYESKLMGIAAGATVNQTDAYLLDRANHTGVQSYTTIVGLSPVAWTGQYSDLFGQPDLSAYVPYTDTGMTATVMTTHDALIAIDSLYSNITNRLETSDFNSVFDSRLSAKTTDNLTEGSTNKYFSNTLARSALSAVTPLGYNSSTGSFSIQQATSSQDGYLSSTDWSAFNNKQTTLVSGTSIKTIESQSLLGSGNVDLSKSDVGLSNVDNTSDATKNIATVTLTNKTISGSDNTITNISQSSVTSLTSDLAGKQATLVSGTNIKTVNGNTLLGSGDLSLSLGEVNTASNVGTGSGWFKQKSGSDLQFKTILGTSNQIVVTNNTNEIVLSTPTRIMSAASRSLVTTTSSTGFQLSSTRDYNVNYSVYAQVTAIVLGTNTADVYLEIAATNSTTPGDWTTISRSGISVAGVVSTSGNTQTVGGFVPAGYYARIRVAATGANAGSAVFTYQVGQENTY